MPCLKFIWPAIKITQKKKAHAWWKNQHAAVCCGLCDEEQPLLTNKTKQKNLYWEPAEKQRFICFD